MGPPGAALTAAEAAHGAPRERSSDRGGGDWLVGAVRGAVAGPAGGVRPLAHRSEPLLPLGTARRVGAGAGRAAGPSGSAGRARVAAALLGQHHRAGASAC